MTLRLRAAMAVRRAGLAATGGAFMAVGGVFLTIAAWLYLSAVGGALLASLVLGTLYFGLGLVFTGLSRRPPPTHPGVLGRAPPPGTGRSHLIPALVEAFAVGMSTGRRRRR